MLECDVVWIHPCEAVGCLSNCSQWQLVMGFLEGLLWQLGRFLQRRGREPSGCTRHRKGSLGAHAGRLHQCVHRGGGGADPPPPPLSGAKMFERSRQSYKPIWRNWLAPQAPENFGAPFKGAGRTPCVYTQNAQFFPGIFPWAPRKAGFVQPLLIL